MTLIGSNIVHGICRYDGCKLTSSQGVKFYLHRCTQFISTSEIKFGRLVGWLHTLLLFPALKKLTLLQWRPSIKRPGHQIIKSNVLSKGLKLSVMEHCCLCPGQSTLLPYLKPAIR